MLDDEPPINVLRQTTVNATNAGGLPLHSLTPDIEGVSGRMVLASGNQIEAWRALAIDAEYELITLEDRIQNGDFLLVDSRTFRVTGTRTKRYAKGTIPDYWKYPCQEISKT